MLSRAATLSNEEGQSVGLTCLTDPLPHYLRRSRIKSVTDQRSWRGSEVSAGASALCPAGSPERPWRGATSEPGRCAPAAAACSLEKLTGALHKQIKKKINSNKIYF